MSEKRIHVSGREPQIGGVSDGSGIEPELGGEARLIAAEAELQITLPNYHVGECHVWSDVYSSPWLEIVSGIAGRKEELVVETLGRLGERITANDLSRDQRRMLTAVIVRVGKLKGGEVEARAIEIIRESMPSFNREQLEDIFYYCLRVPRAADDHETQRAVVLLLRDVLYDESNDDNFRYQAGQKLRELMWESQDASIVDSSSRILAHQFGRYGRRLIRREGDHSTVRRMHELLGMSGPRTGYLCMLNQEESRQQDPRDERLLLESLATIGRMMDETAKPRWVREAATAMLYGITRSGSGIPASVSQEATLVLQRSILYSSRDF